MHHAAITSLHSHNEACSRRGDLLLSCPGVGRVAGPWERWRPGAMTMDEVVLGGGADEQRSEPDTLDVEQFARALRRVAIHAYEIMNRPDATTDELVGLRRRLKGLLRAARGSRL